ncbi:hypothetical protein LAZ67_7001835 [Cordylochernes scorpioides]|uniref:Integrase catalytic domain-containing protein n=1 Tax=Cordylochernes scorpioides TaxID=51811 RepID=A0ABY6KQI5_9ARAC|nr:hypothetical protein LAZ67_7001835 [Cordylochernes scorpioides]
MVESSKNIQKFDGNNFTSWKFRIICILEGKDLDGFIKEDPPKDEKITVDWKRKDAQARGIITCAMDDTQVSLILTCKTSKEIWTALHSRYEGNIKRKCIEAKNNVSRLTMKKEETWEQYLLRAEKLLQEARILGGSIEDEEFITAFIRGLPPKYNLVSMQFDNYPDATISDIRRIFELHEERNKNNKDENAAYNMGHKFNKNFKKNSSDSNRERKPKCFICQKASLIGENHNQETAMNLSFPEFNNKCKWILDSGATSHMSKDINLMDDIQDDSRKITLPDDRFIKSKGIGTVEIYQDDNHLLTLKEVLYVPELNNNLISVSKITEHEKQIIFDENGARIIDNNGSSIITAKREDNIYTIDACANIKLEENVFKTQENNWKIWHKRLAHICENYMNMMLKDSMKEIDSKQSTKPLDLIHMDLIGPFQHESIGRAIYVLNIVDDFSRKIFPKFLKSKSETFAKLKEFIELIENIKGTKIKRIRSDNGGEFTNRQLSSYLIEKGIEHQFTTFYSPSQNGIVERANRSLIEGTRALLIKSQLPPKFWAEAMNTYSYIKNRTPHKRNDKTTPEELFTGKKPTIKHLKVFGCRAEYWIPKFKRYKFEKITKSGIFVGYSNKRKAFRICDPKNYAITETRDVSFIEKEKGAELLSNEVKAELPDHVLIDLNFCHKNGQKEEEPISIHQGNVPESTRNEPEEDKNVYNLRPTPEQGFYYESSLSDEDTSQDDTTSDPTYYPADISLKTHKVWDVLPITKTIKPIKSKWVFSIKNSHDPLNPIYKARLVAVGCTQKLGVDYSETYLPVIKSDSLRTLIAFAAMKNLYIHHFDIETAFLYGKLEETIYMSQPKGFEYQEEGKKFVCKLNQAIYGFKQAGRVFYETFTKYLLQIGFKIFNSDKCLIEELTKYRPVVGAEVVEGGVELHEVGGKEHVVPHCEVGRHDVVGTEQTASQDSQGDGDVLGGVEEAEAGLGLPLHHLDPLTAGTSLLNSRGGEVRPHLPAVPPGPLEYSTKFWFVSKVGQHGEEDDEAKPDVEVEREEDDGHHNVHDGREDVEHNVAATTTCQTVDSGVNPGGALNIRQHQTTLTRFRTGHLKPLKIENNNKIYPTCPKCSLAPAAPEHILACIRCTKQDLWERPLLIIKQLEEHELMEFV